MEEVVEEGDGGRWGRRRWRRWVEEEMEEVVVEEEMEVVEGR